MPSKPWLLPLSLALLLVVAGCTMPAGSPSPDTEGSASEGATTPSESPTAASQTDLPPGVTASGLANASTLVSAHRESLRATGYRLDEMRADAQWTYVAAANYSAYRVVPGPTTSDPDVWANESVAVARHTQENETVYQRPPRLWPSPTRMTGAGTLQTLFNASEYEVNGTAACGDRECTVLMATGSDQFSNFSARALVHESGVVHQFHATYTQAGENQSEAREYHLILMQRGDVSVSRPPWVDTAIENT